MLAPDSRVTLVDSLRPPPGFHLDRAVGTTYTLNLSTLLVVPTAYALFAIQDTDPYATDDASPPIGLLDALRRTAGRITVFCDAAQIAPPGQARRTLLGFVEDAVIPVRAPAGGVFHPKVWALRYVDTTGSFAYRLLVGTRNLTFDRSWDTMVVLDSDDGGTGERVQGIGDFLRQLPAAALVSPTNDTLTELDGLASDLDRVEFALPAGFSAPRLHSFGFGTAAWPFPERCDRLLVVAPFLSGRTLERLPQAGGTKVLVSRPEALSSVGPAAKSYTCRTLNPAVLDDNADDIDDAPMDDPGRVLSGLHAKLYIVDDISGTRWWTGSANATQAAFSRNVEVLLELVADPGQLSVDAMLRDGDHPDPAVKTFRDLFMEWAPDIDPLVARGVDQLDDLRRTVAGVGFTAAVVETADGFDVTYTSDDVLALPTGVQIRCWPVSLPRPSQPTVLTADGRIECRYPATIGTLTAFLTVELSGDGTHTVFVIRCLLLDPPVSRQQRILVDLLGDADRLVRYLLALLSDEEQSAGGTIDGTAGGGSWVTSGYERLPLTERMVRAAARHPARLADIASLLEAIREAGGEPLPEELTQVWEAVWQLAREQRVGETQ